MTLKRNISGKKKLAKVIKKQEYRFEKAKELRKNPLPEVKLEEDLARALFDSEEGYYV